MFAQTYKLVKLNFTDIAFNNVYIIKGYISEFLFIKY